MVAVHRERQLPSACTRNHFQYVRIHSAHTPSCSRRKHVFRCAQVRERWDVAHDMLRVAALQMLVRARVCVQCSCITCTLECMMSRMNVTLFLCSGHTARSALALVGAYHCTVRDNFLWIIS